VKLQTQGHRGSSSRCGMISLVPGGISTDGKKQEQKKPSS
jgi:hypothetical protein